ncbi:hypothetical protein C9374_008275 [Naegleria lovaniensis]|uniref:Uncharacterized protein n=1 Tax=Naegleria lovaniensis TaxID=51637 RepID=A0AA88GLD1_NAELO|nr:uncharacterized protein C9374_008275 [Naegleria lovaniensis]KAG2378636.1 hypothetical protein C9374_008275 [Naegleria lovaniensis]
MTIFPNEEIIGMDQDFFALSSLLQFGHQVRHELRACRRLFIHVPFWGNNEKFHSKEKLLQIIIKKELNEYSEKEQEEPLIELGPGDSCLLTNENVALFGKSLEIVFKTKELMDQASRETTNAIDSFLEFVVFDMIVHSNSSH